MSMKKSKMKKLVKYLEDNGASFEKVREFHDRIHEKFKGKYDVSDDAFEHAFGKAVYDACQERYEYKYNNEMFEKTVDTNLSYELEKAEYRCSHYGQEKKDTGISGADLNIISHPALTELLPGSQDDSQTGSINWFDMELVSAISQAVNENPDKKRPIRMGRVYELIYGRPLTRREYASRFIEKAGASIEKVQKIDKEYYVNGSIYEEDSNLGVFFPSRMMSEAFEYHNLIVIPHRFLNERECKTQDMKNYILYRYLWKKKYSDCILLDTMEKQLGFSVDGKVLKKVLDSLAKEGVVISKEGGRLKYNKEGGNNG